jgi:hypothetical protein
MCCVLEDWGALEDHLAIGKKRGATLNGVAVTVVTLSPEP